MKSLLITGCLMIFLSAGAQTSLDEVLQTIEENNVTLKTARLQTNAAKVGNRTGLNPENPEVEYIYQWGNREELGNKSEFSITQSIDFPSAYRYRNKLSASLNEKAERDYLAMYNVIMLDVLKLCYEIIHYNALVQEYHMRLEHAQSISQSYHARFDEGEINILERNKADLNLLNARTVLMNIEAERQAALEHLQAANGGIPLVLDRTDWPLNEVPADFDDWFTQNSALMPQMMSMEEGLKANRYNEQLNKALSLPKISGGYSSETNLFDQFKGVNLGLTIPLWENKNKVKAVELYSLAMENELTDTRLQLYHGLKALYNKAARMKTVADDYKAALSTLSNTELLRTALNSGEISILEYMMELAIYYEAIEHALAAEVSYRSSLAQMNAFQPE